MLKNANNFSSLICRVILSQYPNILINSESTCKRDPPLSFHYRLFIGKHVLDIIMTSAQTSSRFNNRTSILTELKDTCETLDETIKSCTEKKYKLEMLIKTLSEEEGGEKADGTDEEEDNKDIIVTSDEEETRSDEDQWYIVLLCVVPEFVAFVRCALDSSLCTL